METKQVKLPNGIPGHNLGQIEREIPASEPPAWPVNDELKVVGKRVRRTDGCEKVTGKAKFTSDIQLSGCAIATLDAIFAVFGGSIFDLIIGPLDDALTGAVEDLTETLEETLTDLGELLIIEQELDLGDALIHC